MWTKGKECANGEQLSKLPVLINLRTLAIAVSNGMPLFMSLLREYGDMGFQYELS